MRRCGKAGALMPELMGFNYKGLDGACQPFLDPKAEDRRPKEGRNPKTEKDTPRDRLFCSYKLVNPAKNSSFFSFVSFASFVVTSFGARVFGLPSTFDLRPSDFPSPRRVFLRRELKRHLAHIIHDKVSLEWAA